MDPRVEAYERVLVGPLFRPFAEALLDLAGLGVGETLLDVACGTGVIARLARMRAGPRARTVGVDLSAAMLAGARDLAPDIDWREGEAARLPVASKETFDVVSCHQGLQFFADKHAAIREMRRVLVPGGRLALGMWRSVEEIPLIRDLQQIAERHVGTVVDRRHSFGDPLAVGRALTEAGFQASRLEIVTRTARITDGARTFLPLNTQAIVGMSAAAKRLTDGQRAQVIEAITDESAKALRPYLDGTDLVFAISSTIAIAPV
jgi:ubiquinone/menaquinone biosynthesis C-methylase UbiE